MKFPHCAKFTLAAFIATSMTMSMMTMSMTVIHAEDEKPKAAAASEKSGKDDKKKSEETIDVKIADLDLKVPKSWKQSDAPRAMRLATFEIPAAEGDKEKGELAVSSFPGGGGGIDANISRWVGQFSTEGREVAVHQGKAGKNEYFIVNISGTFGKTSGPPFASKTTPTPGQRMISIILNLEGKNLYFLKLTGPDATVAAQIDAVRASIGGDADSEKEYEF